MGRDDGQLSAAKRAYKQATLVGNRQEEARWANVIGDILKNRGEYVLALQWLRIDYEISVKYLPEKQLLPTCQSLGEVYLRLQQHKEALIYQKKHLELARDSDDLVEQQRACTQLGRTYHELFLKSDDDHYSVRNAKKYFKSAMDLARTLKEHESASNKTSSFLKEFIDAHNNMGLLQKDLDNLEEAEKVLLEGLRICDEEEVIENDDARSRLHHNLGSIYMEKRNWDKARRHIEKDIIICKNIGHRQGEAKGYINLGELHYRVHKYEDAILCYQKALDVAKLMEDEDALVDDINQNLETTKEAVKVNDDLKKEEQNLKKLMRATATARGTPRERKCLLEEYASLDRLIDKSSIIYAWLKHLGFAKRKKRVANELCDKEKLSDSFLAIGESYQKLRKFEKAHKWYIKGLNSCNAIGNLEGKALAKINIGDVLDSDGDWVGALKAFEEGYRIAIEANKPNLQISALENMHYSHMIRFDNVEEARRLQLKIKDLKSSVSTQSEAQNLKEFCSETETEEDDRSSDSRSNTCTSKMSGSASARSKPHTSFEQFEDDAPLISLARSSKKKSKSKIFSVEETNKCTKPTETSSEGLGKSTDREQPFNGRKRPRVVLSDDDSDGQDKIESARERLHKFPPEHVASSDKFMKSQGMPDFATGFQAVSHQVASRDTLSACTPINLEESTCSYKSVSPILTSGNGLKFRSISAGEVANTSNVAASGSKTDDGHDSDKLLKNQNHEKFSVQRNDGLCRSFIFKIDGTMIHSDAHSCMVGDKISIECMKVEVACLYYLELSPEKRSKGLLPLIRHMKCGDKDLESWEAAETLKDCMSSQGWIEVAIDGWVQKRLIKSYLDNCQKLYEAPNIKLLKKLYNLEVSEDEVIASECELQDISVTPLLSALKEHQAIAILDLSHNLLGNGTMEKLQEIFVSSSQKYGGLTLDLHYNRFGPTSLFQICECPVLFARLEVLNISGNRLTDSCGSYLSTILGGCKALYSLNIERCSITSRTIQKMTEAIDTGCVLAQLYLGHNNPISGTAMVNFLTKLATLKRFSELSLNGIKLSKSVIYSLCQLVKTSCLSGLMLGATNIGADGGLELVKALSGGPQELVKLDLSFCVLTYHHIAQLYSDVSLMGGILDLNLGGNFIGQEGANTLASVLMDPQCSLKDLVLNKCHLGLDGIIKIMQALAENHSLEELNLEDNVDADKATTSECDLTPSATSKSSEPKLDLSGNDPNKCSTEKPEIAPQVSCVSNIQYNHLEVADSEDGAVEGEPTVSAGLDDSCTSSCQRNNNSFRGSQLIQELSTSISMAKQLQLLKLSNNGFTTEIAEALYTSWSSSSRQGSAQRHIKDKTVHFTVEERKCCGVKLCCRRD